MDKIIKCPFCNRKFIKSDGEPIISKHPKRGSVKDDWENKNILLQ